MQTTVKRYNKTMHLQAGHCCDAQTKRSKGYLYLANGSFLALLGGKRQHSEC